MYRLALLAMLTLALLVAACGKDATAPKLPRDFHLSDPEILFHFLYHKDSLGVLQTQPYPDTAIMRWYKGTPEKPDSAILLAEIQITGTDTTCAFFLVADSTPLYFDVGWKRHGVTIMGLATVGPFNPLNPNDYDHYWDVMTSEDTLADSRTASINSSRTTSFCTPIHIARDSIAAPVPAP